MTTNDLERAQMELLADAIQLAINWGIEDSDDEQSVTVTVEREEDSDTLWWRIADSYDFRAAHTPAALLEEAATWVREVNLSGRQHAEDMAEEERLRALEAAADWETATVVS